MTEPVTGEFVYAVAFAEDIPIMDSYHMTETAAMDYIRSTLQREYGLTVFFTPWRENWRFAVDQVTKSGGEKAYAAVGKFHTIDDWK